MTTWPNSEIGSHVRLYLYRIPTKNHDAIVHLSEQFANMFGKYDIYARSFKLESFDMSDDFNSAAEAVSANQDEEVWLDLEFTNDNKHREDVDRKIQNDASATALMKQFLSLLVTGSKPIKSDFIRPA